MPQQISLSAPVRLSPQWPEGAACYLSSSNELVTLSPPAAFIVAECVTSSPLQLSQLASNPTLNAMLLGTNDLQSNGLADAPQLLRELLDQLIERGILRAE